MLTTMRITTSRPGAPSAASRASARPAPTIISTRRTSIAPRATTENDNDATAVSGEWPVTWSLASYEDVGAFFQKNVFQDTAAPDTLLSNIMSTNLVLATPEMKLSDARHLFDEVTGVPVVRSATDFTLIGVLSRKDIKERGGEFVADAMTREPIALPPHATVADAAGLCLQKKIHRIPIVDAATKRVLGIVTRTDIFTVMLKNGTAPA